MITRITISDEQAQHAIDEGEFGPEIISAAPCVAVVLTQSWCPQWIVMERWLRGLERDGKPAEFDLCVAEYVYDKSPISGAFRRFKEGVYRNGQIPYVRYYHDGRLISQSNYVGSRDFLAIFADATKGSPS
ncbi:MAG: hypothetical protein EA403_10590 [Spirochaetaceae bacterium]|nr:MAG: hypothetical protein EA403_10590 [Spirochaetaceae bacterium]